MIESTNPKMINSLKLDQQIESYISRLILSKSLTNRENARSTEQIYMQMSVNLKFIKILSGSDGRWLGWLGKAKNKLGLTCAKIRASSKMSSFD